MDISVSDIILKSLEYYDNQNKKYEKYIKSNAEFDTDKNIISIKEFNYDKKYEILGFFYTETNVWTWSWLSASLSLEKTMIARELLNYSLKLEPSSNSTFHFYLKTELLNSRMYIDSDIKLDLHLAVISYLCKDKYLFIYPRKEILQDNHELIAYYLVK
jgi:hypothetical protein